MVVYYHVAGGWPRVEENDLKWNGFVCDIEELGRKIQKARGDDPVGELRTWVDERIWKAEDESVYRDVMLGHRKIEPDVRLVENILRMIARVSFGIITSIVLIHFFKLKSYVEAKGLFQEQWQTHFTQKNSIC